MTSKERRKVKSKLYLGREYFNKEGVGFEKARFSMNFKKWQ